MGDVAAFAFAFGGGGAGDDELGFERVVERSSAVNASTTACTVFSRISTCIGSSCRRLMRMCSRVNWPQNLEKPLQRSQSTDQLFFTSLVHATAQPRPARQRAMIGVAAIAL